MYIRTISQLNEETYKVAKPKFEENGFSYMREEKEGCISCHSSGAPFLAELVINATARKILELCNGKRTPEGIVDELFNIYKGVEREVLESDLKDVLFEYTRARLISWEKGENPFMLNYEEKLENGYTIQLAKEDDLRGLCEFVEDNSSVNMDIDYLNPTRAISEYSNEMMYRQKLFSYSEEFVVIKNEEQKIVGVISVLIPVIKISSVSAVGIMKISSDYFAEAVKFMETILPEVAVAEITKIKLQLVSGQDPKELADKVLDLGFISEGVFQKEIGNKDIEVLSYIY